MTRYINANINAGKFFIRKSKLENNTNEKFPEFYIEVFNTEGVAVGTTGVWLNTDKNGSHFYSGDLSKVSRNAEKEPYVLTARTDTKPRKSTDPFEGKDGTVTNEVGF